MPDVLLRDLRSAARSLAARPGWTGAAILCLAIATGANTAAFTLVNGLLLRSLPYDQPEGLANVALREATQTTTRPFSLGEYRELAGRTGGTGQLLARTFFPLSVAARDDARMAQAELVSGNYFEVLRLTPFLGRFFDASHDRDGAPPVAVMSHNLWQRRFAGEAAVIGETVRVNGRPVVVMGIAPAGFSGVMQLIAADLWLPAATYPQLAGSPDASDLPMFGVMARLSRAVTIEEAAAQFTTAAATLRRPGADRTPAVVVAPATGIAVPIAVEGALITLSGVAYAVMASLMAVACANVGALVLARAAGRSREIAVRLSLGAARRHIARQLTVESAVLASAGCGAGTLLALWLAQILAARLTTPFEYVSYAIDLRPDARVFAFSALLTGLTTIVCGIVPLRHARRVDVADVLRQSVQGTSPRAFRTLHVIVVTQLAVSTTLLTVAGVAVRAYLAAAAADPGSEIHRVIAATLDVAQVTRNPAGGIRLYEELHGRLASLPGVAQVSLTSALPFQSGQVVVAGAAHDSGPSNASIRATARLVSHGYFRTLGLSIRSGRAFDQGDRAQPPVAVVNEDLAERLWPGSAAIGRRLYIDGRLAEPIQVVGVVADAPDTPRGTRPAIYRPFPHPYSPRMTLLVRVHGDAADSIGAVRNVVRSVDHDLAILDLRTVRQLVDATNAQRRLPAAILSLVGMLGLALTAVGLYGVVTLGVRNRTRELGIRLALGARPRDVKAMILRQGGRLVAAGLLLGGGGAVILAQVIRHAVFGTSGLDARTAAAVGAVLLAVAGIALYLPARWASRLEPARTLRLD